jgi:uncharacterized protein
LNKIYDLNIFESKRYIGIFTGDECLCFFLEKGGTLMELNGYEEFSYKRIKVWEALHDPEVLKKVIPGCESMEIGDNGEYLLTLSLGVAAIKGRYEGKASLINHDPPHYYTLQAEGSGNPGFVNINMDCYLDEKEDSCTMRWECNVIVGGLIAGIGGRVLSGIAKFMAKNFFKAVKKELKDYNPVEFVNANKEEIV